VRQEKGAREDASALPYFMLQFSEVYRVTEPEEKRHGHNVQDPPVSRKPLKLIHG
jgi:hypothetical protein